MEKWVAILLKGLSHEGKNKIQVILVLIDNQIDLLLIIVPEKYIYYDLKIISRNRRSFSKQRRPLLAQKNLKKIEHFDKSWHFLSDVDGYLPKNQIFGTGNQYQKINPF